MLQVLGPIQAPFSDGYFKIQNGGAIFLFISNLFKLAGVVAGILLVFQLIVAGYDYITANGDSKKVDQAWQKIWQSILGIIVIASAFTIAGVVERLTGLNILNPALYGPNGKVTQ